jgi:AcrR family transcriptional regulator
MLNSQNKKFNQLVQASENLFLKYAMKRITIQEICITAGVSKMTFYKYFTNKKDLTMFIIKKVYDDILAKYISIIESNIPLLEKMSQIMKLRLEIEHKRISDFFSELIEESDIKISEYARQEKSKFYSLIIDDFRKMQSQGIIRSSPKPEFIVNYFEYLIQLNSDKKLLSLYNIEDEFNSEIIKLFVYGILT